MPWQDINLTSIIVSLIGGSGFVAGLVALFKFKSEKESIIVTTATNTLEAQTKLNENLLKEIDRLNKIIKDQLEELETIKVVCSSCSGRISSIIDQSSGVQQTLSSSGEPQSLL